MKKLFYVLSLALLASCNNVVDLQQVENENAGGRLPQVTVINQLGEVTPLLASAVAQGQWKATSRGKAAPEIESIEMIKDSKGNPAIYVVNNANNQGFTLISATMDYNPIIATSDEGHFSWEAAQQCGAGFVVGESIQAIEHVAELPDSIRLRFNAAWEEYTSTKKDYELPQSRSSEDVYNFIRYKVGQWESQGYTVHTVENYMSSYAYSSLPYDVQTQIRELPYAFANPNYGGIYNVSFVLTKTTTVIDANVPAMITTNWSQGYPFNSSIPYDDYNVGCVPVAMGQIMNYHGYPTYNSIPDFLFQIRRACHIPDNSKKGTSGIDDARSAFIDMGYTAVTKINHNAATVSTQILNGYPVFMSGTDVSSGLGHAWVADGIVKGHNAVELKLMCLEDCPSSYTPQNFDNPYNNNSTNSYFTYFHMNWGWLGSSNGNYTDSSIATNMGNYNSERKDLINIYH